jgi:hypothetical protein
VNGVLSGPGVDVDSVNTDRLDINEQGVVVILSSSQSVTSGSDVQILFDDQVGADPNAPVEVNTTNNSIEILDAGRYRVSGYVGFNEGDSAAEGDEMFIRYYRNNFGGTPIRENRGRCVGSGFGFETIPSPPISERFSAGDELYFGVYHQLGANTTIDGSNEKVTAINIDKIG